jgi:hypothetical protein
MLLIDVSWRVLRVNQYLKCQFNMRARGVVAGECEHCKCMIWHVFCLGDRYMMLWKLDIEIVLVVINWKPKKKWDSDAYWRCSCNAD